MEWLTLGLFCGALLACIALHLSILYALAFGLVVFLLYGRHKGFTWPELGRMAIDGVMTVRNILITFMLIGILTALWRGAGTISAIICWTSNLIRPSIFLLMTFLLNCMVSILTGTALGTGATIGVICATMARAMGIDMWLVGGAVLAGAYFGDRCSPVSTSALLVSELTGTVIYDNIRNMVRTGLIPFLISCAIYTVVGFASPRTGELLNMRALFDREFVFHWVSFIPAVVILVLAAFRIPVKQTMAASILSAIPICILIQHVEVAELLHIAVFGFSANDPEVGAMINGGGIVSMLKPAGIVCLSSSYSDIFRKTGMLDGIKHGIERLADMTTSFAAITVTSIIASAIACNQTLAVIMTNQLCSGLEESKSTFANDLEDTAVVIAPLIPWSIAATAPLSAIGANASAIVMACFLYVLPVWGLGVSWYRTRKKVTNERLI